MAVAGKRESIELPWLWCVEERDERGRILTDSGEEKSGGPKILIGPYI